MKYLTLIVACWMLALASGCTTPGVPAASRIVGGGAQIDWQSQQVGTAILIERTTGKVVITRSLVDGGDPFSFDFTTPVDSEVVKKALGTVPVNPEFVLYFVPAKVQD